MFLFNDDLSGYCLVIVANVECFQQIKFGKGFILSNDSFFEDVYTIFTVKRESSD